MSDPLPAPELVEEVLVKWVHPQRKRIAALLMAGSVSEREIGETLRLLTEAASETLGVERTSVWKIRGDGAAIDCIDLYRREAGTHEGGLVIEESAAPRYFRALATERVIAAHDAMKDPRTSEFAQGYLAPLGITSMLDAPAFVRGRAMAVVCHEHVGPPRRWQFWEELVASTFADFVATVLEAESRSHEDSQRDAYQKALERKVAERTQALSDSERNLQALLDAAPIPLVLTRAADHAVSYANARAFALFEMGTEGVLGLNAADFWVDDADRKSFLSTMFAQGRVDELEVRLRSRTGRVFWARMNAQAVRFRGELSLLAGVVDVTEARQARQNLSEIFASAPVAMVLSRLTDGVLLDGNVRAEALFEITVQEAKGMPAPDFWVEPSARNELRELVKREGRVDGFEAELRTRSGREFWAELSAAVVEFDGQPALLIGGSDVTERINAQDSLRRRENTVRTLLVAAPYPLAVTRLDDGVLRYANEPFARMFELSVEECVGRPAPDLYVNPQDRAEFLEALRRKGHVEGFTALLKASSGRALWALMNARTLEIEGEEVFMVGFADLTAQKQLEEKLRRLATTDSLTGAVNRRRFFEVGEAEFSRATRYGHRTSLAMLDIDHFKAINDELGHAVGDDALVALVEVVRAQIRAVDLVARVGGEEFVLLLPETGLEAAEATVERVRAAVSERAFAEPPHERRRFTVSAGVVERRKDEKLAGVLKRADAAMYEAKGGGRNRVIAGN